MRGKLLYASVSALVLGLTTGIHGGAYAQSASEQDAACAAALQANTVEAIEAFLNEYPGGVGGSACRVLAQSNPVAFGGNDSDEDGEEDDGNDGKNNGDNNGGDSDR